MCGLYRMITPSGQRFVGPHLHHRHPSRFLNVFEVSDPEQTGDPAGGF
jgi:hypothetical protein